MQSNGALESQINNAGYIILVEPLSNVCDKRGKIKAADENTALPKLVQMYYRDTFMYNKTSSAHNLNVINGLAHVVNVSQFNIARGK